MTKYWFMSETPEPPAHIEGVGLAAAYKWCKTDEDKVLANLLGMRIVESTTVDGWELRSTRST